MNYEFLKDRQCFDKVVLVLTLNRKKMTERIIIGETAEVKLRLENNIGNIFYDETRQLGQFLLDFEADPEREWNVNAMALMESYGKISLSKGMMLKSVKPCADFLRRKYENNEPSAMFAAISTWENYLCCYNMNHGREIFVDKVTSLYKPFYVYAKHKPWELESFSALETVINADDSKVELWYPVRKRPYECAVAFSSLLPTVYYYLNKIEDWGLKFQICKVCGVGFLTTSKHYELCSDECRKVTAVEAKQQFNERNKGNKSEQFYETTYQYWYNRLRKLKRNNAPEAEITAFSEAFEVFRNEAVQHKAEVKSGKIKLSDFTTWLAEQQDIVDGIVKHGRG